MRFDGHNFYHFFENQLNKLASLVQSKRVLMYCPED